MTVRDQELSKFVIDYLNNNPDKYKVWTSGPFWHSNLSLLNFFDAIMHLMFLEVAKSTQKFLGQWISENRRAKTFHDNWKDICNPIISIGLD